MSSYLTPPTMQPAMKPTQHLIMSPQMQQAIRLLQVPIMELASVIELEMEQNPLLEYAEDDHEVTEEELSESEEENDPSSPAAEEEIAFEKDDFTLLKELENDFSDQWEQGDVTSNGTGNRDKSHMMLENVLSSKESLQECLLQQSNEAWSSPKERRLAEAIIGSIDRSGILATSLEEIAAFCSCQEKELTPILEVIQTFDPPGVGARCLQEALLIQLYRRGKENSTAYSIIRDHYDAMLHNQIPAIAKALKKKTREISEAIIEEIVTLDVHPGLSYGENVLPLITADVSLRLDNEGKLVVEVNDEYIPPLRLNKKYLHLLGDETLAKDARDFVKQKVMSAKWLLRNILQRNETIARIAGVLAERQRDFFTVAQGKLSPLTMRMVAEELGIHESTVARTVANKYIDTPRGLLPLRSFFTNAYVTDEGDGISSKTVRQSLHDLIADEDHQHPYSDRQLSSFLRERGISCARRTIAKYRRELGLGNAQQRRKY